MSEIDATITLCTIQPSFCIYDKDGNRMFEIDPNDKTIFVSPQVDINEAAQAVIAVLCDELGLKLRVNDAQL